MQYIKSKVGTFWKVLSARMQGWYVGVYGVSAGIVNYDIMMAIRDL